MPPITATAASAAAEPKTMTGAEILVEALVRAGVEVVFAYPGGASMPIHQALTKTDRIRTILPRFEQGGGFAAEGIARVTGKVGVCMATSGPGATNFITCLADAKLDSLPILAITGQVGTAVIGTDAFQETPMVEISRPVTKHHYLLTRIEDIPRVVREAVHIATTGRPGPVVIDVPKDVSLGSGVVDFDQPMRLPGYQPEKHAADADLRQVLEWIGQAQRPVLYAGGGITSSMGAEQLTRFAERLKIPVALTLQGLGCLPGEHYLSLDMLGMHGSVYSNYAVDGADLLLAFGVRFDDRVTGKVTEFCRHGRIVHIDIDPSELNKNKPAQLPIEGDVRHALTRLNEMLDEQPVEVPTGRDAWLRQCDQWRTDDPLGYTEQPAAILPQQAIQTLWRIVKDRGMLDDTIVTTGVGQHQMWAAQFWKFTKPRNWVTSGGLGSMGFGLPSAMGVCAVKPDKLVIDIDGDGSFLMNVQELATCHVEKLPVKILLLNNQHLGMVVQWEDRFFDSNRGHTYLGAGHDEKPYPDFCTIAKGFGIATREIRDPADLHGALEEMLDHDGPYLLNVHVPHQEHVLPMIPSGKTVADIIKV